MATRIANRDARAFIRQRSEFVSHTGSLRGTGLNGYEGLLAGPGSLPEPFRTEYTAAQPSPGPYGRPGGIGQPGTICYVVFSYSTPIAWYVIDKGWVRPDVKYSPTTSRHQGLCPLPTEEV